MGRPAPTPQPEAELWMGAHPSAPSEIQVDGAWVPLPEWVRRDPLRVLGLPVLQRFGPRLPFLFKLLAAERALSVQVHPDEARARRGFERENSSGLRLDDPRRSYRDANGKPELLCALSGFEALCGFRSFREISASLEALDISALEVAIHELDGMSDESALRGLLLKLFAIPEPEMRILCGQVVEALDRSSGQSPEQRCVLELAIQHPGDIGILAPLLLYHVKLAPGEALFLEPGRVHAYLEGFGVELMADSDNVLRGALTSKATDVQEFVDASICREGAPAPLRGRSVQAGEWVYETSADAFELRVIRPSRGEGSIRLSAPTVQVLLCSEGEARVRGASGDDWLRLAAGESVLVPAGVGAYELGGEATVFRAGVPG
jgi:mannose-6-phosphate isomerase